MSNNKPSGRIVLTEKEDRDNKVNGGALWTATRGDGTPLRFNNARVFNVSLGDRELDADEVAEMMLSGDYFIGVIVEDE